MSPAGPLSGFRVVEWAHVHLGPGEGMFLSDMGADAFAERVKFGSYCLFALL